MAEINPYVRVTTENINEHNSSIKRQNRIRFLKNMSTTREKYLKFKKHRMEIKAWKRFTRQMGTKKLEYQSYYLMR